MLPQTANWLTWASWPKWANFAKRRSCGQIAGCRFTGWEHHVRLRVWPLGRTGSTIPLVLWRLIGALSLAPRAVKRGQMILDTETLRRSDGTRMLSVNRRLMGQSFSMSDMNYGLNGSVFNDLNSPNFQKLWSARRPTLPLASRRWLSLAPW
jgi:hypothetical protein